MITAAIFLDFDNVYLSLKSISRKSADQLHRSTQTWVDWFREGLHEGISDPEPRRIVLQRCYLNPAGFSEFRQSFTRSGFEVVDCPALTSRTKNSADINMVMDIMDLLRHETRIDEFIIFSADADFTPVLHRIRLHDRKATIFANDMAAAALKNSASIMVDQDSFVAEALGIDVAEGQVEFSHRVQQDRIEDTSEEVRHVAGLLLTGLRQVGRIPNADVPAVVLRGYPPFKDSSWLGHGSLNALLEKICEAEPQIKRSGTGMGAELSLVASEVPTEAGALLDLMQRIVTEARAPVLAAQVGSRVTREFGPDVKNSDWFGFGSMGALVAAADRPNLKLLNVEPGYLMDPERHTADMIDELSAQAGDNLRDLAPELIEFITRINEQTGWPKLAPDQLDAIFQTGSQAIAAGTADRNALSKSIRDGLAAKIDDGALGPEKSVSRQLVNFILTAILQSGFDLETDCASEQGFRQAAFSGFIGLYETRVGQISPENKALTAETLFGLAPQTAPVIDQPDPAEPEGPLHAFAEDPAPAPTADDSPAGPNERKGW